MLVRRAETLREDYVARVEEHVDGVRDIARKAGWTYALHVTDTAFAAAAMTGGYFWLHQLSVDHVEPDANYGGGVGVFLQPMTESRGNPLLTQAEIRDTQLAALSNRNMKAICDRLNGTPRKCLGWRTPTEAFRDEMMKLR